MHQEFVLMLQKLGVFFFMIFLLASVARAEIPTTRETAGKNTTPNDSGVSVELINQEGRLHIRVTDNNKPEDANIDIAKVHYKLYVTNPEDKGSPLVATDGITTIGVNPEGVEKSLYFDIADLYSAVNGNASNSNIYIEYFLEYSKNVSDEHSSNAAISVL